MSPVLLLPLLKKKLSALINTAYDVKFDTKHHDLRFLLWTRLCRTEVAQKRRRQRDGSVSVLRQRTERRVKIFPTNHVIRYKSKLLATTLRELSQRSAELHRHSLRSKHYN